MLSWAPTRALAFSCLHMRGRCAFAEFMLPPSSISSLRLCLISNLVSQGSSGASPPPVQLLVIPHAGVLRMRLFGSFVARQFQRSLFVPIGFLNTSTSTSTAVVSAVPPPIDVDLYEHRCSKSRSTIGLSPDPDMIMQVCALA